MIDGKAELVHVVHVFKINNKVFGYNTYEKNYHLKKMNYPNDGSFELYRK